MQITRRKSLALIGSAVAAPLMLRTDDAAAATFEERFIKRLGSAAPGMQDVPHVAGFNSNGSTLATWTNFNGSTMTTWCQYFSRAGAELTDPTQLDTAADLAPGTSRVSRPLTFADGKAMIIFSAKRDGAPVTQGDQLFVQRMSANRTKVGPPIRINGDPDGETFQAFATELTDGNVMVIWARRDHTPPFDGYVVSRVITRNGEFVSPRRRVTEVESGTELATSIAALSSGRSVFAYFHNNSNASTYTVACQRLNASGERLGDRMVLKTTSLTEPYGSASVASGLSTGNNAAGRALGDVFDTVCYRKAGANKWKVWAGRYRANGQVVVPEHPVFAKAETVFSPLAQIAPFSGAMRNGVTVVAQESQPAGGQQRILAQVGDLASTDPFPPAKTLVAGSGPVLGLESFHPFVDEPTDKEGLSLAFAKSSSGGSDLFAMFGIWVRE